MNSAKEELVFGLFLINFIITVTLDTKEQRFKRGGSIFFDHMTVNFIDVGTVPAQLVGPILYQQINPHLIAKVLL